MSRLATRNESDLQPETLEALSSVRLNGRLADVYLQFANSEYALRAYLQMEACLRDGSLDNKELEAVKLWVSEQTKCEYCLSIHSFKGRQAGLDEASQLAIRTGQKTGDDRIDMLLKLVAELFTKPGKLDVTLLEAARQSGISDKNLIDLTMAVSTIFFTNITNHINDSISPLPAAPPVK